MLQPRRICSVLITLILVCCLTGFLPAEVNAAPRGNSATATAKKKTSSAKPRKKNTSPAAITNKRYKGAILYNVNANKVVFAKGETVPVPPASLTKILSLYVALDTMKARKISPNAIVTVSAKAASMGGSRMGLRTGNKVPLEDLLFGMAVASGNDASIAVAEYIGGTEANFVRMMNQKAKQIGMTGSIFYNANGLPIPRQVTTARDMLTLARSYLRAYPNNLTRFHSHRISTFNGVTAYNANPLLGNFPGADGLKTGYVTAAGYNLVATAKRDQIRLIGVILGAPTSSVRSREAVALMDSGFGNLACPIPLQKKNSTTEFGKPGLPLEDLAEQVSLRTADPQEQRATSPPAIKKKQLAKKSLTVKKTSAIQPTKKTPTTAKAQPPRKNLSSQKKKTPPKKG